MELQGIYRESSKVKRIFQKEPGIDGFSLELEDGSIREVSRTQWHITDNSRPIEGGILFSTSQGEIFMTNAQVREIGAL